MRLTPKEQEKLLLHMAGNLAKERRARGLKLNYPESVAYISSELMEMARDGKTVTELMQLGTKLLTKDDVMDGVADLVGEVSGGSHLPRRNQAGYPFTIPSSKVGTFMPFGQKQGNPLRGYLYGHSARSNERSTQL